MRKLIAFCVVIAVTATSAQAFAQCPTCTGSAPVFAQPTYSSPQVFSAPVDSYAAPVESYAAPMQSYAAPMQSYAAPMSYESTPAYSSPVVSSGCSSCGGGMTSGGMTSGEMSPYSTQGLPPGAVVISDVVTDGGEGGTVEGTVVGDTTEAASSPTEAVQPPSPEPQAAVETLPTEDTSGAAEGSDTKNDGT